MKRKFAQLLAIVCILSVAGIASRATPIPENCQINGFALGCQAYSFKEFSVFDAIDKTAAACGKVIEFYPGQKFSAEKPELKFDHNATEEMIAAVKARLEKDGIRAVNYGVVAIPKDEAAARKIFEFAKKMELYGITTESVDSIDTIEKFVKEYDIRVGFHEHPRKENKPEYKMWDPNYILSVVKDRDVRIGSCADVGHWFHSGLDPVDCLKILQGRIISAHLKDEDAAFKVVPFGAGKINIPAILEELKRQHFVGNASIEYEANWKNSVGDIAQCVVFVRDLSVKK
jgi:sugar phosphate isomerase/epimerase